MQIHTVGNYVAKWGEGPVWYDNQLCYVDIEGRAVIQFDPGDGSERIVPVGERVGTVVMSASGKLVIAGDNGFSYLDPQSGSLTAIVDPEPELSNNRFNDGKCSPDGRFFAGSISLNKQTGAARLYRLDSDLSIHTAFAPVTNSNGIVWSLAGDRCYYIDSPSKEVKQFNYDAATGELSGMRVAFSTHEETGSPDGMTIDSNGNLWIAFCHGGCVVNMDPASGQPLQRIELPCRETTACAFGGPDLSELYITTGIPATEPEPLAGRLFQVKGLKVRGVAAVKFRG